MARLKRTFTAAEIAAAERAGRVEMAVGAASVVYDRRRDAVEITMRSGTIAIIPRALIPVVADAAPALATNPELSPMGTTMRFPALDADFTIQALIRRVFGINEANRLAGATKSAARAAASRSNGTKGGRPRTKVVA